MKRFLFIYFVALFLFNLSVCVFADTDDIMKDTSYSAELTDFLDGVSFSITNEEPENELFCIDVSDSGLIGIGSRKGPTGLISVYSSDGIFKYSYSFYSSGAFGFKWENDDIVVYFVRGDCFVRVDSAGKITDVRDISNKNIDVHLTLKEYNSVKCFANGRTYKLDKNISFLNNFTNEYSRALIIDVNGGTSVLCDVSEAHASETAVVLVFFIVFFPSLLFIIVVFKKKELGTIRGQKQDRGRTQSGD